MTEKNIKSNISKARPPIVVVLGHVDHGKTSLLDTIRKTKIVDKESGGITQHIGAYQTDINGKTITFLDTPGHEAFASIRSRGAKVADVAILIVAADEGVKPQTKEAINIIKEEKISFVVAINKIDKEGASIQKVKQDLAAEDVLVEDWGGKIPVVEISAKQNKNIDGLLEIILLVAELEDLVEDLSLPAEGVIIESNLNKRRGYIATALIHKGTLRVGDWIVVGTIIGKIKSMEDFRGQMVDEGGPSQPVLITGWSSAPSIGMIFKSALSKDDAEEIAAENTDLTPLFQFFKGQEAEDERKTLNVVFKTDVASSLEAIESSLSAIRSEEVRCRVLGFDIGNISEADIKTAKSSDARVIGFRVGIEGSAEKLAEKDEVKIAVFDVIYELIEFVRKEMASLLEPEVRKNILGKIKILAVFKKGANSQVIGGKITSGKIVRGAMADLVKGGDVVISGKIVQLQHNKEDITEVKEGLEAGLKLEALSGREYGEIKEGDTLEVYEEEKVERTL